MTAVSAHADKTDIVEFGQSRMVGEVKRLHRGKLYFKTDATDTIQIDWEEVTLLITDQHLRVERRDGSFGLGSFVASSEPGTLAFSRDGEVSRQPMSDIVAFEPLESGFWDRLDIDTSIGYARASSDDVEQLSFDASFGYDTENRSRSLRLSSQSSQSQGNDRSTRRNAAYQTLRYRNSNWFTGWLATYEDNDALDLDYRITGGAVFGKEYYPQSNQRFRAFAGLALSEERFSGADGNGGVQGVFGGTVDWFEFSSPELDLASSLVMFPSFTDWGRVRAKMDVSLRWEIIDDLYWQLSFYDDYDSEPLDENDEPSGSLNDYGITTSLGWSW